MRWFHRIYVFIYCCHLAIVFIQCPPRPMLLGFAFRNEDFTYRRFLEPLSAPLSFAHCIVAKLQCSCLCLLDVIVELHQVHDSF
jgi:hypothetical protein